MARRTWKVAHEEFPASFGVLEAQYDSKNQILIVEVWNHGAPETLAYADVPEEVFEGLVKADSKGGYFNRHIRNSFSYVGKAS